MKKKNIILGSLAISGVSAAFAVGLWFMKNNENGSYKQEALSVLEARKADEEATKHFKAFSTFKELVEADISEEEFHEVIKLDQFQHINFSFSSVKSNLHTGIIWSIDHSEP